MSASPFPLKGRSILITGASSGLGRRFAQVLASGGAKLAVAARRKDRLASLVNELKAAGSEAVAVSMDVEDEASIIAGYDAAEAVIGPINGIIANAGMNSRAMAADISAEEFDKVFSVNTRGVFLTAREGARRAMKAKIETRIALVASIGAVKVLPGLTAYCASKAAIVMMGRCLSREWANRGINVNILCPGYIRTELNSEWFDEEGGKKQIAGFPRRRLMEETDLDAIISYLMADASRAVTGSVFTIDDGQTL
ncbi:MAG TPA: SDR family NAD(P)-dependent oxidoreductase [Rhizomicrobium sp.]|jgi:NAD(P)-dependent dehydrogenase (short-subunit alcohol dehydrogenase family)|nr:SDR family NAD(P)-dependent oxidoreductase [Rhizomicrobium sp.]